MFIFLFYLIIIINNFTLIGFFFFFQKFIQQLYLHKSKVSDNEASIEEYRWGSRAEKEIDKGQVLEFVAMVNNNNSSSHLFT